MGGNLTQVTVPDQTWIQYYYFDTNTTDDWGAYYSSQTPVYEEEIINAGGIFSFPQSVNSIAYARRGNITFNLYQNIASGLETKIISRYAHQILAVVGKSISISMSGLEPTITIGLAYQTTPQQMSIITA